MAEVTKRSDTSLADWPALRVAEWTDTRDTLHMWTQIVGKLRLANAPMINHWWQVVRLRPRAHHVGDSPRSTAL